MNPLPSADPAKVIAYIRTSSAEQGKAFGPDAQRSANRTFAGREGLTIADEVHEDISGTTTADEREGLQAAIAAAYQHGAASILVSERSRLARDEYVAYDALRALKGAGLRVLYADGSNGEDDSALLIDGIGHVIAAHDRRRIVARLRAGRAAKAAKHPHSRAQGGKLPHGYRRDDHGLVEVDPDTAGEVRRIFDLIRDGKTIRATADAMSEETGRAWKPTVVDRIVKREIYKRAEPGRIVDPRLWNAAQKALAKRRRRK